MACDGGKQPVFAFGDFNIPAEVLRSSGMLEALGLEIVTPAEGSHTCTAGKGSTIDYLVCTKGWGQLIYSSEVAHSVPCGTHLGAHHFRQQHIRCHGHDPPQALGPRQCHYGFHHGGQGGPRLPRTLMAGISHPHGRECC